MAEKQKNYSSPNGIQEEDSNYRSLRSSDSYFELPDSIYQAQELANGNILHRGMEMVGNSLKAHRACNEAIIFVYGLSGAGKTASLNHLFGFELINIEQNKASHTKLVTEYVARMVSREWRVKNLDIGFIDMPGWFDTYGEEQDIRNVATIDHFLANHSFLGCLAYKCYPSIVLVAIRADDKRLEGDGAKVPRMFRVLSKLNILDKQRPNLLIILTHVLNVGRKNFKTRLKQTIETVEQLAYRYLEVEPAIVYIENDTEEFEELEEKKGDWTVLRDGTLQPKNVFKAMMQLTSEHKDEVGQEAIRLYFTSRGSNKPLIRSQSSPDSVSRDQIRKWRAIIQQTFPSIPNNEVSRALQSHAQSLPQSLTPSSLCTLMEELSTNSLTHLGTLRTLSLDQVQQKLSPYNLSQLECQALMEGCGVRPPQWTHTLHHIGYGVNTSISSGPETETTPLLCSSPVFSATEECQEGERTIPTCMQVVIPIERRRVEWKRMEPAPQTEEKEIAHPVKYQFQISQCVHCIKLLSNQKQQLISLLSPAFKEAVAALPDSSVVEESQQVREEYQHFFNTYGHFVIVAFECGGVVQGEVKLMEKDANDKQQSIKSYINNLMDKIETDKKDQTINFEGRMSRFENTKDSQDIAVSWKRAVQGEESDLFYELGNAALSWKGGIPPPDCTLHSLTHHTWMEWTASLHENPAPPDYSQLDMGTVLPIYELIGLIDQKKSTQVQLLYQKENILQCKKSKYSNLFSQIESIEESLSPVEISEVYLKRELVAKAHVSQTLAKSPGGFPESATVVIGSFLDYLTVGISKVKLGDRVLCLDPWESKFQKIVYINAIDKEVEFNYLNIVHEYGELLIGYSHTILRRQSNTRYTKDKRLVVASSLQVGDVIYFVDNVENKYLESIVCAIDTKKGRGHYSLAINNNFADIVVNKVVTGDEDAACFPGNASVTLKGGEKVRMDEVKIGDYVLSIHPSTGKPVYSKVYLWAHRDPHITATFLHITHPHGHLHISANHLILSGEQRRPVPAGHLAVGDTIHSLLSPAAAAAAATAISVPVLHIHTCTQVGYYAPFTNNGLIVVDGIASSVYSQLSTRSHAHVCASVTGGLVEQFGMHRVGECVMAPVRVGCKLGVGSLILTKQMDTATHIHKYCQWLMKIYEHFM